MYIALALPLNKILYGSPGCTRPLENHQILFNEGDEKLALRSVPNTARIFECIQTATSIGDIAKTSLQVFMVGHLNSTGADVRPGSQTPSGLLVRRMTMEAHVHCLARLSFTLHALP